MGSFARLCTDSFEAGSAFFSRARQPTLSPAAMAKQVLRFLRVIAVALLSCGCFVCFATAVVAFDCSLLLNVQVLCRAVGMDI